MYTVCWLSRRDGPRHAVVGSLAEADDLWVALNKQLCEVTVRRVETGFEVDMNTHEEQPPEEVF